MGVLRKMGRRNGKKGKRNGKRRQRRKRGGDERGLKISRKVGHLRERVN